MKHLHFYILGLMAIGTRYMYTAEKMPLTSSFQMPSVQVYINNSPSNNLASVNENQSTQVAENSSAAEQHATTMWYEHISEQSLAYSKAFFQNYYYHCIAGSVVCAYAVMLYKALYARWATKHLYWTNWKSDYSLEELMNADQQLLQQELLHAIHLRYIDTKEPLNTIYGLIQFLHDIAGELHILQTYQRYTSWMYRLQLYRLLPFSIPTAQLFSCSIERIMFLESLFKSWAASHKIETYHHQLCGSTQ